MRIYLKTFFILKTILLDKKNIKNLPQVELSMDTIFRIWIIKSYKIIINISDSCTDIPRFVNIDILELGTYIFSFCTESQLMW